MASLYIENMMKDEYLKKSKEAKESKVNHDNGYTFEQLRALHDMAKKDVYPDWRFSDEECHVWSLFRN